MHPESMDSNSEPTLKLDALKITERKPQRSSNALKALEQKLRKFFDEADGHGSLMRKPPPKMVTPQYFKIANTISCYPIKRMDWLAFVNSHNYKKKVAPSDDSGQVQRPKAILGPPESSPQKKQ